MKTPNYVLLENHSYQDPSSAWHDPKIIPAGTFVKPIDIMYVPLHVKERWKYFKPGIEVFVYSSHGMFPVLKRIVREV